SYRIHRASGAVGRGAVYCQATSALPGCSLSVGHLADLNADGQPDFILSSAFMPSMDPSLKVLLADPLPRSPGGDSSDFVNVDIDGDGATDVLMPYSSDSGLRYDALHIRGTAQAYQIEATPLDLTLKRNNCNLFADVNGDGLIDVV